jgi:precorrin-6B methylase 2
VRQRRLTFLTTLLMLLLVPALAVAQAPDAPPAGPTESAAPTIPAAPAEDKPLDAPYAPTPHRVVTAMLEMARVTRNDVLYDLGSGDGRIVITAAKRFGALGVGIDLNPKRIREAEFNARNAGATERVAFMLGDIFDTDLSPATVVTIYLLPDVNRRLLPKLLTELKPGTRIVSHNYGLGDWEPERHQIIDVAGTKHDVYLWTVPPGNGKP